MGTDAIFATHNGTMKHCASIGTITNEVQVIQCNTRAVDSTCPNTSSPMSCLGGASPTNFSVVSSRSTNSNTHQSKENLGEYLTELRDRRSVDYDRDDSTAASNFTHLSKGSGGGGGMVRSKTRLIFSTTEKFQSHPDLKDYHDKEAELEEQRMSNSQGEEKQLGLQPSKFFGRDIRSWTNDSPDQPMFDKDLRNFMEIHISKARRNREEKHQSILRKIGIDERSRASIPATSNAYIPYPSLRNERRFLYDVDTYPLHKHLADIIGVSDLSLIHQHPIQDKKVLLKPLLDSRKRRSFHQCYDNFVTSFCIPLLHSLAMRDNLFNDSRRNNGTQNISYRYQAFPCIRVNRPGEFSIGPHCDMSYGHSVGNINFHIPLTPTYGTNALYAESHPGREDWHPLKTKSIGLGYSFDGARSLHFTLENSTVHTRVSLDFRIAIHRSTKREVPTSLKPSNARMMMEYSVLLKEALEQDDKHYDIHDVLCNKTILQDNFSSFPGYYDEAQVEIGTSSSSGIGPGPVVCKRSGSTLLQPDKRVGFPF